MLELDPIKSATLFLQFQDNPVPIVHNGMAKYLYNYINRIQLIYSPPCPASPVIHSEEDSMTRIPLWRMLYGILATSSPSTVTSLLCNSRRI